MFDFTDSQNADIRFLLGNVLFTGSSLSAAISFNSPEDLVRGSWWDAVVTIFSILLCVGFSFLFFKITSATLLDLVSGIVEVCVFVFERVHLYLKRVHLYLRGFIGFYN